MPVSDLDKMSLQNMSPEAARNFHLSRIADALENLDSVGRKIATELAHMRNAVRAN